MRNLIKRFLRLFEPQEVQSDYVPPVPPSPVELAARNISPVRVQPPVTHKSCQKTRHELAVLKANAVLKEKLKKPVIKASHSVGPSSRSPAYERSTDTSMDTVTMVALTAALIETSNYPDTSSSYSDTNSSYPDTSSDSSSSSSSDSGGGW